MIIVIFIVSFVLSIEIIQDYIVCVNYSFLFLPIYPN